MSGQSQRREVFFSGQVQGVGFRYSSQTIARSYDVTGFVKNLPDGRVQLVVEGAADQVDGLVGEIGERMGNYIRDVAVSEVPATGEFTTFRIAF